MKKHTQESAQEWHIYGHPDWGKRCPLLQLGQKANTFFSCEKEDCALWTGKECAITALANFTGTISKDCMGNVSIHKEE